MGSMTIRSHWIVAASAALGFLASAAVADTVVPFKASITPRTRNPAPFVQTPPAEWNGSIHTRGQTIPYRLSIVESPHRAADGAVIATITSMAYIKKGGDPARRPVTFVFGGGPGGAVHMLLAGLAPRSVFPTRKPDGFLHFADNPETLLDATDLVFVDAVGNGYSRLLDETRAKEVIGVVPDARVLAAYVGNWLKANGRAASPKYLLGESYGGARVALMAGNLAADGIALDGVIQISPLVEISDLVKNRGAAAPREQWLPSALVTMAATARHFGKGGFTGQTLAKTLDAARAFAQGPYRRVFAEPELGAAEKAGLAADLSRFTGLSPQFLLAKNLTPSIAEFRDELLREQGLRLGQSDSRHAELRVLRERIGPPYEDPSMSFDDDDVTEAWLKKAYGFTPSEVYIRFAGFVGMNWTWDTGGTDPFLPRIFGRLMQENPRFRVLVESGYYDLRMPWIITRAAYEKQNLPADRFRHLTFESGHSIYEDEASRPIANKAIRDFITAGIQAR